jgi:hypothetical protein
MSRAGGNSRGGSCNAYEQHELENIERNKRKFDGFLGEAVM